MRLQHPGALGDLTPDELTEWRNSVRAAAVELTEQSTMSDEDIAYSRQLVDWAAEITTELDQRAAGNADADDVRAALAAITTDNDDGDQADDSTDTADTTATTDNGDGDAGDDGDSVTRAAERVLDALATAAAHRTTPAADNRAAGAPSIADLAAAGAGTGAPAAPAAPTAPVMIAAADVRGYTAGQPLTDIGQLAGALNARARAYPENRSGGAVLKAAPRGLRGAEIMEPAPGEMFRPTGRIQTLVNPQRHGAATIKRVSDGEELGDNRNDNQRIVQAAADDWVRQLRAGRTAALDGAPRDALIAAWCAPAEPLYTLCEEWSTDGLLPLPQRTVARGSIMFAEGFDFATVYDSLGDNTADCATLAEGVEKTCVEVPCLEAEEHCLNADWLCITANLLQRRAWPESIQSFISAALAAKLHKTNARIIQSMVDGSTPGDLIACDGDDAFSSFLTGIEVAITDASYRSYMSMAGEWEIVAPAWVLPQLRAALIRRRGIDDPVKADSWMQAQFAKLGATVHFVYGWQDAHVTTPPDGLPGGATPLGSLPTEASILVYPAGTWVKGVQDIISLDTIYDSTNLANNAYTALFVEDGWMAFRMCPTSRVYTIAVDPCACGCDGSGSVS